MQEIKIEDIPNIEEITTKTIEFKESEIKIIDNNHLLEVLKSLELKGYTWNSKKPPTEYIPKPCKWIQLWKDKTISYSIFE